MSKHVIHISIYEPHRYSKFSKECPCCEYKRINTLILNPRDNSAKCLNCNKKGKYNVSLDQTLKDVHWITPGYVINLRFDDAECVHCGSDGMHDCDCQNQEKGSDCY